MHQGAAVVSYRALAIDRLKNHLESIVLACAVVLVLMSLFWFYLIDRRQREPWMSPGHAQEQKRPREEGVQSGRVN